MTAIVVDAAFRAKLLASGGVAEFRDEDGTLIGRFVGAATNGSLPMADLIDIGDEELDRREREERRFTADQVLDRIRGLRK
jgi:hypothetical protein